MDPNTLPTADLSGFVNPLTGHHVTPGKILGYRRDGRPIRVIAGGSGEGDTGGTDGGDTDGDQDGDTGQDDAGKKAKIDGDFDPDRAARAIAAAREDAKKAKAETKAERDRVAAILKAAGLTSDGKTDPAEQLKAAAERADKADQKLRDKSLRLAIRENADKAGVDPSAVIDSSSFRDATAELDPDAADYDDQVVAAMKKALKANPRLSAAPAGQGAGKQGADHNGAGGGKSKAKNLTEAITARLGG